VNAPVVKLYLDEDVDVLIVELLRARGFLALTTVQADNLGHGDREQLQYAMKNQLCLLTHNRADFEELAREYFAAGELHYGIIIAVRRPPKEIVRRLLRVLNFRPRDEMQNQLLYI
jgi:predicted nuclease of predicted toxin-antitoxin system